MPASPDKMDATLAAARDKQTSTNTDPGYAAYKKGRSANQDPIVDYSHWRYIRLTDGVSKSDPDTDGMLEDIIKQPLNLKKK